MTLQEVYDEVHKEELVAITSLKELKELYQDIKDWKRRKKKDLGEQIKERYGENALKKINNKSFVVDEKDFKILKQFKELRNQEDNKRILFKWVKDDSTSKQSMIFASSELGSIHGLVMEIDTIRMDAIVEMFYDEKGPIDIYKISDDLRIMKNKDSNKLLQVINGTIR